MRGGGRSKSVHAKKGMTYNTKQQKRRMAVAFWKQYTDETCQIVSSASDNGQSTRLRPTNMVTGDVYNQMFLPFMKKSYPGVPVACIRTFRDALKHPLFADIAKRPKHNHCRFAHRLFLRSFAFACVICGFRDACYSSL